MQKADLKRVFIALLEQIAIKLNYPIDQYYVHLFEQELFHKYGFEKMNQGLMKILEGKADPYPLGVFLTPIELERIITKKDDKDVRRETQTSDEETRFWKQ